MRAPKTLLDRAPLAKAPFRTAFRGVEKEREALPERVVKALVGALLADEDGKGLIDAWAALAFMRDETLVESVYATRNRGPGMREKRPLETLAKRCVQFYWVLYTERDIATYLRGCPAPFGYTRRDLSGLPQAPIAVYDGFGRLSPLTVCSDSDEEEEEDVITAADIKREPEDDRALVTPQEKEDARISDSTQNDSLLLPATTSRHRRRFPLQHPPPPRDVNRPPRRTCTVKDEPVEPSMLAAAGTRVARKLGQQQQKEGQYTSTSMTSTHPYAPRRMSVRKVIAASLSEIQSIQSRAASVMAMTTAGSEKNAAVETPGRKGQAAPREKGFGQQTQTQTQKKETKKRHRGPEDDGGPPEGSECPRKRSKKTAGDAEAHAPAPRPVCIPGYTARPSPRPITRPASAAGPGFRGARDKTRLREAKQQAEEAFTKPGLEKPVGNAATSSRNTHQPAFLPGYSAHTDSGPASANVAPMEMQIARSGGQERRARGRGRPPKWRTQRPPLGVELVEGQATGAAGPMELGPGDALVLALEQDVGAASGPDASTDRPVFLPGYTTVDPPHVAPGPSALRVGSDTDASGPGFAGRAGTRTRRLTWKLQKDEEDSLTSAAASVKCGSAQHPGPWKAKEPTPIPMPRQVPLRIRVPPLVAKEEDRATKRGTKRKRLDDVREDALMIAVNQEVKPEILMAEAAPAPPPPPPPPRLYDINILDDEDHDGAFLHGTLPKALLPELPPVWCQSRQEMCESSAWFRSYQGGIYHKDGMVKGYFLSGFGAVRDRWEHGGKLVISHGGGKAETLVTARGTKAPKKEVTVKSEGPTAIELSELPPTAGLPPTPVGQAHKQHIKPATDQSAGDTSVRALLNNWRTGTPLVLLIDDKYAHFPWDLAQRGVYMAILGFYRIVNAWAEYQPSRTHPRGAVVRWKFAFQWCEGQGEPWWIPQPAAQLSPSAEDVRMPEYREACEGEERCIPSSPPSESAMQTTASPPPAIIDADNLVTRSDSPAGPRSCVACHVSSPQVYTAGWACLNAACTYFFHHLPSGSSNSPPLTALGLVCPPPWRLLPCAPHSLAYNPAFLQLAAPAAVLDPELLSSLVPRAPAVRPVDPALRYAYENTRGWRCDGCGRLSCRSAWEHYECPNCNVVHSIDPVVLSAKDFMDWPIKVDVRFVEGAYRMRSNSGIECLALRSFSHALVDPEPGEEPSKGMVQTFVLPGGRGSIHLIRGHTSALREANDIFEAYQREAFDGRLVFRRYPLRSHKLRGPMLTSYFSQNSGETYRYVGGTENTTPFSRAPPAVLRARALIETRIREALGTPREFNEVLSAAYMEEQQMGFHTDSEPGLGPTVAGLSMGSPALMKFRLALRHLAPDEKRSALLEVVLRHGDVCVMDGAAVQEYYEHTVVPSNFRIAATARWIAPDKHLGPASRPRKTVAASTPSMTAAMDGEAAAARMPELDAAELIKMEVD